MILRGCCGACVQHASQKPFDYWKTFSLVLDALGYFLFLPAIITRLLLIYYDNIPIEPDWVDAVDAIEAGALFFYFIRFLKYLTFVRSIGPKVLMIGKMV